MFEHGVTAHPIDIQPILAPAHHRWWGAEGAALGDEIGFRRLPHGAVPVLVVVSAIGAQSHNVNAIGGPACRRHGACECDIGGRGAEIFPLRPLAAVPNFVEQPPGFRLDAKDVETIRAPGNDGWSSGKFGVIEGFPLTEPGSAIPVLM